jgi:hypothetical protein
VIRRKVGGRVLPRTEKPVLQVRLLPIRIRRRPKSCPPQRFETLSRVTTRPRRPRTTSNSIRGGPALP